MSKGLASLEMFLDPLLGARQAGLDDLRQGIGIKQLAHGREVAETTNARERNFCFNAQNVSP
jgi:hypothetical protein